MMSAAEAKAFADIAGIASLQISISTMSTAVLCLSRLFLIDKWQRSRGINGNFDPLDEPIVNFEVESAKAS